MKAFYSFWKKELEVLKNKSLFRELRKILPVSSVRLKLGERELINFSSNDYLGLTHHPKVMEAFLKTAESFGCGAGASRLVTGNHLLYQELEDAVARFKGFESALVFTTGYTTNLSIISTILPRDSLIVCDKLSHASIIDGILLSGRKFLRFKHNDVEDLERILKKHESIKYKLVITEGVFSMDGDIPPLKEVLEVCKRYSAILLIDDAHATGVLGKTGRGSLEYFEIQPDEWIICMGTLSKALGTLGGFCCGKRILIEFLVNKARPFIFTTALPAPLVAGALAGIRLIESDTSLVTRLRENIELFKNLCSEKGIFVHDYPTPIFPIVVEAPDDALKLSQFLFEKGFLVPAIRPPAVPPNTARLRISLSAEHQKEDILALVECLREGLEKWGGVKRCKEFS